MFSNYSKLFKWWRTFSKRCNTVSYNRKHKDKGKGREWYQETERIQDIHWNRINNFNIFTTYSTLHVNINAINLVLSRFTVACCVDQENGVCTNRVSISTGTAKSQFSHIRGSVMSSPNGTKFTMKLAFM